MKKTLLIAIIIGCVVSAGSIFYFFNSNGIETVEAKIGDLVKEVEMNGKVVPAKEVELSFEASGRIAGVYADVGDTVPAGTVIAELDSTELAANLRKAEIDLEIENISLKNLVAEGTATEVSQIKQAGINSINQAFATADQTLRNTIDQLYEEPRGLFPKIIFAFNDYQLRLRLNEERFLVGKSIANWGAKARALSIESFDRKDLEEAKRVLNEMAIFLDNIAKAVNSFEPTTTLSQSTIDTYKNAIGVARTSIQNEIQSIATADNNLRAVLLKVPTQEARVNSSKAVIDGYRAQISKRKIISPIKGVITSIEAKVGQTAQSGQKMVSIATTGELQIELFVPEISIAAIIPGNKAKVTLDAFSNTELFEAEVLSIEPKETIRDGVSTYKTTLVFSKNEDRIKPGMTANVIIETDKRNGVVVVPRRSLFQKDNEFYVQLKNPNGAFSQQRVTVGVTDSFGNAEILSGISAGDIIARDPKTQ